MADLIQVLLRSNNELDALVAQIAAPVLDSFARLEIDGATVFDLPAKSDIRLCAGTLKGYLQDDGSLSEAGRYYLLDRLRTVPATRQRFSTYIKQVTERIITL